jgi:hypothetical protein
MRYIWCIHVVWLGYATIHKFHDNTYGYINKSSKCQYSNASNTRVHRHNPLQLRFAPNLQTHSTTVHTLGRNWTPNIGNSENRDCRPTIGLQYSVFSWYVYILETTIISHKLPHLYYWQELLNTFLRRNIIFYIISPSISPLCWCQLPIRDEFHITYISLELFAVIWGVRVETEMKLTTIDCSDIYMANYCVRNLK